MTKEKAIKHLEIMKSDYALIGDIEALDMAISALSENNREWTPVTERLPDEIKTRGHGLCHVLVTHKYAGITRTHQAVFDQGKFFKLETYREDNTVTAWMPLPEPYEKEGE